MTTAFQPAPAGAEARLRPHPEETRVSDAAALWDARAATWDRDDPWPAGRREYIRSEWKAVLRDVIGDEPRIVVEVGFGTGDLALVLQELGHVVRGADISREMVRIALAKARRRGAHLDLRHGDAERLPFRDGAADVVVIRNLAWTLPSPEAAVAEFHRVLRPGGRVLVAESRWMPRRDTLAGRTFARCVPGGGAGGPGPDGGPVPFDPRGLRGEDAAEFLRCTGFHRAMVLDLAWLRRRTWADLPWAARALARPLGVHYVAWADRL